MDQAQVVVTEDLCGGQETVELVDVASGHSEVVSDESFAPDPGACGQPAAVAQTLAVSAPLSK